MSILNTKLRVMSIYSTIKLIRYKYFFYNLSTKKLTLSVRMKYPERPPICCTMFLEHQGKPCSYVTSLLFGFTLFYESEYCYVVQASPKLMIFLPQFLLKSPYPGLCDILFYFLRQGLSMSP